MVTAGLLYLFSWERHMPGGLDATPERKSAGGAGQALKALYRNLFSTMRIRAFRLHLGMYLGGYISQDIFNAAFTFFVIFALSGSMAIASGLLGTMYIVQFVAVIIAINLALRASPAKAYQVAAADFGVGVFALLALWLLGVPATSPWIWLPIILVGLGRGALNYIPWATYNYMADVDEIVTGQRREGSFAGVMTFVRKATQAAAVVAVGFIMQAGGFVSGAQAQSHGAILTMALLLGVGTVGCLAFGIVISRRFRLSPATHDILMREIEHLRSGATTPSSPAAAMVVEDLSGWRYDQLWGNNPVARSVG
jgi:oligogalacturonide transporter